MLHLPPEEEFKEGTISLPEVFSKFFLKKNLKRRAFLSKQKEKQLTRSLNALKKNSNTVKYEFSIKFLK
jgi:hypothetical protein